MDDEHLPDEKAIEKIEELRLEHIELDDTDTNEYDEP